MQAVEQSNVSHGIAERADYLECGQHRRRRHVTRFVEDVFGFDPACRVNHDSGPTSSQLVGAARVISAGGCWSVDAAHSRAIRPPKQCPMTIGTDAHRRVAAATAAIM